MELARKPQGLLINFGERMVVTVFPGFSPLRSLPTSLLLEGEESPVVAGSPA
jgi:hypothetical protein